MCILFVILSFISITLVENAVCSLLSRLKNRYEYISYQNNSEISTEDLYVFEFTKAVHKSSPSNLDVFYMEYNPNQESMFYSTVETKIANGELYNELYRWTPETSVIFDDRPTINPILSTMSKSRKTWPTYFPRKTPSGLVDKWNISLLNTEDATIETTITVTRTTKQFQILTRPTISIINTKNKTNTPKKKALKSWCYRCGLNETDIPMQYCYNSFTNNDQRYRVFQNRYKIKCVQSPEVKQIKNTLYGPMFRGGCFIRFLDVGTEYNERGCRTFKPTRGKSFASKRFASLETLLNKVEDGCIFSPHSSITPFSRAISLYARYHVCVCSQKYCNNSNNTVTSISYLLFMFCVVKM